MSKDKKINRTVIISVILVLIKGVLSFVGNSVCTITFHQPSEPNNIQNFINKGVIL